GLFATFSQPRPDQSSQRLIGILFLALGTLGVLWPALRLREREELKFARLRSRDHFYEGILVPVSRAYQIVTSIGSLVLAALSLTMAITDKTGDMRAEAWCGFVAFLGIFVVFSTTLARNKPGILLTSDGIVWNEFFHNPAFIEWNNLSRAEAFN